MGWQDSHAHEFRVGEQVIGPQWWIQEMQEDGGSASMKDERRVSVASLVSDVAAAASVDCLYDMGDGGSHRIIVETATIDTWQYGLNQWGARQADKYLDELDRSIGLLAG